MSLAPGGRSRGSWTSRVGTLGDDRPVPDRPEGEEDRGEADDDVDDGDRQLHPDAEREERRPRDTDVPEGVDQQGLLGPDPAGRRGNQGRQAHRRLDEERVAEALGDSERGEEEPDRREPEAPVGELPHHDRAGVARRRVEDGERLGDATAEAVPEVVEEPGSSRHDDDERDHRGRADDAVLERPRVVEGGQRGEGVERRQHALRERPHEYEHRERHVDERQDDGGGDDRRVRAARDRPMGKEDLERRRRPVRGRSR